MNDPHKTNFGSKISKWENNFMNRHPVFHPIITEFIAELLIAVALAVFAFNMLPPDLTFKVFEKPPHSSVLSIKNKGFIFADGEYGIKTKSPLKEDPVVTSGKEFVDQLERRSKSAFGLQVSGLPYKTAVKVEFKSNNITVEEE